MAYTLLAGIIIFLALLITLAAGRMLLKGSWILGWLRGMVGLVLLSAAVIMALSAFDFYSYQQISREKTIATLSFTRSDPQQFQVSLVDNSGVEQRFEISGDLWQLDARIIKWNKLLSGLGLSAGYRLDRLSGRYYSLEKEKTAPRSVYELSNTHSVIDVWQWLREHGQGLALIDASYGSATYLPMEDGALFSVNLSATGLVSRPLNDRAKAAVIAWQ
jgi:hypothetical protein